MYTLILQHQLTDLNTLTMLSQKSTKTDFSIRFVDHKNTFIVKGWSTGDDIKMKYQIMLSQIDRLMKDRENVNVSFDYEMFDTSTTRFIFLIIRKLNQYHTQGKNVNMLWIADAEDGEMIDTGLDFSHFCMFKPQFQLK